MINMGWVYTAIYTVIEFVFYLVFVFFLHPRANDLSKRTIKEYRDFAGTNRHLYFERMVNRLHERCLMEKKDFKRELNTYWWNWFYTRGHEKRLSMRTMKESLSVSSSPPSERSILVPASGISSLSADKSSDHAKCKKVSKGYNGGHYGSTTTMIDEIELYQDELKVLLASCFFDKHLFNLKGSELEQLDLMFHYMKNRFGIQYPLLQREDVWKDDPEAGHKTFVPDGATSGAGINKEEYDTFLMHPRYPPLDKVNALHRPLLLYAFFWIVRYIGYSILFCLGFRPYMIKPDSDSKKFLRYWFFLGRRGGCKQCDAACANDQAILFFHGIAPGGLTYYIPLLRRIINNGGHSARNNTPQQSIFLFENIPLTCSTFSFEALTDVETVHAIEKVLTKHGFNKQGCNITLSGQSFGSYQVTWMLTSSFIKERVQKIILLDPTSILMTEPDCTMHAAYGDGTNEEKLIHGDVATTSRKRIKLMASTELFIAHYLRRHFTWFNSELWIEDIPDHIQTYVMVSGNDLIIDASEVRQEVHRHMDSKKVKCIFWDGHGHGDCLLVPKLLTDVSVVFSSFLPHPCCMTTAPAKAGQKKLHAVGRDPKRH